MSHSGKETNQSLLIMHCPNSRLSQQAFLSVLSSLNQQLVYELLHEFILTKLFSEWGALLLQQEVLALLRFVDELMDTYFDVDKVAQVKEAFLPLQWTLKALTLDAPGDIRRYLFPSVSPSSSTTDSTTASSSIVLSEELIRQILGRRVEFSKDAVAKVKINFRDDALRSAPNSR